MLPGTTAPPFCLPANLSIDRAYRRWVKAQAELERARDQLTRAERGERRERELLLTLCDVRDEKGARR